MFAEEDQSIEVKVEGRTEMVFTQSGHHVPPENYAGLEVEWRSFFDDLSVVLSG